MVTEDVTARYAEWRKRGVQFQHTPRLRRVKFERPLAKPTTDTSIPLNGQAPVWGGVFTRFRDQDGNSFLLVGFDEVTREVEAQRRAIADRLEAEHRAAQELEIAKQVQARLFPHTLPALKTLEYAGICVQALNIRQMQIGPQIDPGVPWCYATSAEGGLHLALKSGNFGSQDFFCKAFAFVA